MGLYRRLGLSSRRFRKICRLNKYVATCSPTQEVGAGEFDLDFTVADVQFKSVLVNPNPSSTGNCEHGYFSLDIKLIYHWLWSLLLRL